MPFIPCRRTVEREDKRGMPTQREVDTMGRRTQQLSASLPAIIVALVIFTGGSPLTALFYAFLGAVIAGIIATVAGRGTHGRPPTP